MNEGDLKPQIILLLCTYRAKGAYEKSKQHSLVRMSLDNSLQEKINPQSPTERKLHEILPHRRKWKKLGKLSRFSKGQRINSIDYNVKSLLKTINWYEKNIPQEPFLIKLNEFVEEVISSIKDPLYKIEEPKIIPKPKKPDSLVCRPICTYNLKDKIIISIINKYLTKVFDKEFYEKSHAFRSSRLVNGVKKSVNHSTSIQELSNYKKNYKGKRLWVSECDISKFFDTVNHTIAKRIFTAQVRLHLKKYNEKIDPSAIRIFHKFLDSYNFVRDVLPLNNNAEFWKRHRLVGGNFEWVEKDLIRYGICKRIKGSKIGVPQGGAISGLIANLVLNQADKNVLKTSDERLLYLRFCDDMIIVHPRKHHCEKAALAYFNSLIKLKLVPHKFEKNIPKNKIWDSKSKSAYRWGTEYQDPKIYPWIGFVGYEMNFMGDLRVRKKSLKKELTKQEEAITRILKVIDNENKRRSNSYLLESASKSLIGMSVGKFSMWNYQIYRDEMCWTSGFELLKDNPYLRKQIRQLDKNRNHQLAILKRKLKRTSDENVEYKDIENKKDSYRHYGRPFSYFYHVIEKRGK